MVGNSGYTMSCQTDVEKSDNMLQCSAGDSLFVALVSRTPWSWLESSEYLYYVNNKITFMIIQSAGSGAQTSIRVIIEMLLLYIQRYIPLKR